MTSTPIIEGTKKVTGARVDGWGRRAPWRRRRASAAPWNINIHYDAILAGLAHPGDRVLDVGCGDGFLAARLARRGCDVVALDADAAVLARARARWSGLPVRWVHADVARAPFAPGAFDVVVTNATLHHLPDTAVGLRALRDLVRPGGRLGVVGFARSGPLDWPMTLAGWVAIGVAVRVRGKWEHTAATSWPPPLTYGRVRSASAVVLPGRSFRRLLLGRYLITWTAETAAPPGIV